MIRRLRDRGVLTKRVRTPRTLRPRVERAEPRLLLSGLSNPVAPPVGAVDGLDDAGTAAIQQVANTADLAVEITPAPGGLLVPGEDAVYIVTVTNLGPDTATDVVLVNTLPAGVTFRGATFGTFDPGAGTVTVNVGNLPADNPATTDVNEGEFRLGIVIRTIAPGTLANSAVVTTTAIDPTPGNNQASLFTQVIVPPGEPVDVAPPPPRITSVTRVGPRPSMMGYLIQFDQPMNTTYVRQPGNFLLDLIRPDIPYGSRRFVPIPVAVMGYDPDAQTLLVVPSRRIGPHHSIQLTVNGDIGGLTSAAGIPLDGNNDGRPGGNFTTIIQGTTTRPPRPVPPPPPGRPGFGLHGRA